MILHVQFLEIHSALSNRPEWGEDCYKKRIEWSRNKLSRKLQLTTSEQLHLYNKYGKQHLQAASLTDIRRPWQENRLNFPPIAN